jgi:hypothetical protein
MKLHKLGKMGKYAALAIAMTLFVGRAGATLTWSTPLSLSSPDLVGVAGGITGAANGDSTTELALAMELLSLGPNVGGFPPNGQSDTITAGSKTITTTFTTSSGTYAGAGGVVTSFTSNVGSTSVPAGFEYAIAKYDGQGAGYILFYLGGSDAILPGSPADFWTTMSGQYGISDYTAFDVGTPVPEPATVFAGALLLLPFGLSTVRILRRKNVAGA